MITTAKKLKISNNGISNNGISNNVGSINYYKNKSKNELINEIFKLQDQLDDYRSMENSRKIRQNNCINELSQLLTKE